MNENILQLSLQASKEDLEPISDIVAYCCICGKRRTKHDNKDYWCCSNSCIDEYNNTELTGGSFCVLCGKEECLCDGPEWSTETFYEMMDKLHE